MTRTGRFTRRTLLGTTAAAGIGALHLTPARQAAAAPDKITITWWEHFPEGLNKSVRDGYTQAHPNVEIKLTKYAPNDMNQALQLAHQSGQLPDITTTPGAAGSSIQNLIRAGWFQPLTNGEQIQAALPPGTLFEGLTVFGGKIYSLPIFSSRQYVTLSWFNKDLLGKAGVDPATGFATWDSVRQSAQAITKNGGGGAYGWIQGVNYPDRMAGHVAELAQVAGAPGDTDWKTGQYTYGTEPYVQALEFLLAMQKDGSLFPASLSLDARNARARWASGAGALFFDGPWNIGVVNQDFGAFLDTVGIAPIPVPDAATTNYIHAGPPGGVFWVSATSQHADVASDILGQMTKPDYYQNLANRMDQPPLNLDVVAQSDAHPTYKQAMTYFQDRVRLAPSPVVRNAGVADVFAEMKPIQPDIGQIIVGALTGDVSDYRTAMQQYADQLTAERDRAIGVVQSQGKQVSVDDWVFSDWQPDQDYVAGGTATPAATPDASPATPIA